jgi:hypothetical protein
MNDFPASLAALRVHRFAPSRTTGVYASTHDALTVGNQETTR